MSEPIVCTCALKVKEGHIKGCPSINDATSFLDQFVEFILNTKAMQHEPLIEITVSRRAYHQLIYEGSIKKDMYSPVRADVADAMTICGVLVKGYYR